MNTVQMDRAARDRLADVAPWWWIPLQVIGWAVVLACVVAGL